jgi:branched-chain amino acid transport system permease protein
VVLAFSNSPAVSWLWGNSPVNFRTPTLLDFPAFTVFATNHPAYKLFILVISIAIFVGLFVMLTQTRIGLIVQAALTHPHMVAHLGHNVPFVFMAVFGVGAALAGIAGVIAGPALVTQSSMAALLGPILFVVVVVGGLGSLQGALFASLLIGLLQTFAIAIDLSLSDLFAGSDFRPAPNTLLGDLWRVTVAQIAPILPYVLLILVLIFKPTGLFGNRET